MLKTFPQLLPANDVNDLTPAFAVWVQGQELIDKGLVECPYCHEFGVGKYCGHCGKEYPAELIGRDCPNPNCYYTGLQTDYCPHCGARIILPEVEALRRGTLSWDEFEAEMLACIPDSEPEVEWGGLI